MTAQPALFELDPSFRPADPREPDLNELYTPQPIFDCWHRALRFTVDAFSCEAGAKLSRFWTKADDAFARSWRGERVFVNNPYDKMFATAAKIDHEMRHGCEAALALWPGDRAEQPFWSNYVEPFRDSRLDRRIGERTLSLFTLNIRGRIPFEGPAARHGSGMFPSVLAFWTFEISDWFAVYEAETARTGKR